MTGLPAPELYDTNPEAFYSQTVATTWQVSMEAAHADAPSAPAALAMAAHLAPDSIPRVLFNALTDTTDLRASRTTTRALSVLHRYNLVELTDTTVSVHLK